MTYNLLVMRSSERLDLVFHALADPTRRAMLQQLAGGERAVNDFVDQFDISQPAITKHLNVLERAGLITRQRSGRLHLSAARREAMREPLDWIRRYARLWNDRLDSLEALLDDPSFKREITS